MSKETVKKLMSGLRTNEELKKKTEGITDPVKLAELAVAEGYDVTLDELIEAEKELRAEIAKQSEEISKEMTDDDLMSVAGGDYWSSEDASDGHEIWCHFSYHGYDWFIEQDEWCQAELFRNREQLEKYRDQETKMRLLY